MTLIISAVSIYDVLQVSDRLVSRAGQPFDRSANKNIVLLAADAVVSIAYTGIAYIADMPTDEWIVEACIKERLPRDPEQAPVIRFGGRHPTLDIGRTLAMLKLAIERALGETELSQGARAHPLELMIAGWQWGRRLCARPVLYRIQWHSESRTCRMGRIPRHPDRSWRVQFAPAQNARYSDPEALKLALSKSSSGVDVERALVDGVRRTASALPGVVGPDVMSIHIPRPGASLIRVAFLPLSQESEQFYGIETAVSYTPWIVAPGVLSPPRKIVGSQCLRAGDWRVEFTAPRSAGPLIAANFAHRRHHAP